MCHLRGVGGQANGADSAPSSSPLGHPQGHRRPQGLSPSSLPLSCPLQQWPWQLSSPLTNWTSSWGLCWLEKPALLQQHSETPLNPCCSVRGTPEFIQLLLGEGDVSKTTSPPAPSNPPAGLLCSSFAPGYCFKFRNDKLDSQTLFLHCFVFSLYFEHCTKRWRDLLCSHTLCIFCTFPLLIFEISLLARWRRSRSKNLYSSRK